MSFVTVIGAGIAGLTTAVRLQEGGHDVAVVAARRGAATTTAKSAGLWLPFLFGESMSDATVRRARATLSRFTGTQAAHESVRALSMWELRREADSSAPAWARRMGVEGRAVNPARLPRGFRGGWSFDTVTVAPLAFLDELEARLERPVLTARLASIGDVFGLVPQTQAVVNCTGLGARQLCADTLLVPVRGVSILIPAAAGSARVPEGRAFHDELSASYVLPRADGTVVGTTVEPGREDETVSADEIADVLRRAAPLFPGVALAGGTSSAGARPMRPEVRLETGRVDGRVLVHNYGHGASGITLCWGCADDVAAAVDRDVVR